MSSWDMTIKVTLEYMTSIEGPYAAVRPKYMTSSRSNTNYCVTELLYPAISVLCVGDVVMLLNIFILEKQIMNVPIDIVK